MRTGVRNANAKEKGLPYQLSVSETKTPWSVVRPFVGFLDGSKVTFWRSATLAVLPVADVNASLMAPMVEDMLSSGGSLSNADARHGE